MLKKQTLQHTQSILLPLSWNRKVRDNFFHVSMVSLMEMTFVKTDKILLSDHIFRTPFDVTVSRSEDMTTESSPDLEDKEVIM